MSETENKGILSSLYTGSADLGVFMADLGMVVGLILGVMILLVGFNKTLYEDDLYLNVMGRVKKILYKDNDGMESEPYYVYNVMYNVGDTTYNERINQTHIIKQYMNNEPISLWVDKNDHNNVSLVRYNGPTLMSLALIIVSMAYVNYYLTHRFKFYAAGKGTSTVFNMFI